MAEGGRGDISDNRQIGDGGISNTVEVRGFSANINKELLEMYFENSRRSGGGDTEEVQIGDGVAYITFMEAEVAQRVVSRSNHQVDGQTLTVALFYPSPPKPCYENRVLIQGLNNSVTEELLTNFLEKVTEAKVREFMYGEEEGKVVVTLSDNIDIAQLRKIIRERCIDRAFLQVTRVDISNCIIVQNIQSSTSHDVVLFYFENKRRSGGGDIERVEMKADEGYCLVYFEDPSVIDRVLSQSHKVDGADVEVHLHHECLGRRSSRNRFDPYFRISSLGPTDSAILEEKNIDNKAKDKTSSSVSSNPEKESDFVEVPEWQENDGKNCTLTLWMKYKRAPDMKIVKDMKKVPCSWNFHLYWNFYTKTKQGQQMLHEIISKYNCSVAVCSDEEDLFIFEISAKSFEQESDVAHYIHDVLDNVYKSAQQFLYSDIILVEQRMQGDVLQLMKQRRELDIARIELMPQQDHDAMCVICTEKDKSSVLHVVTEIIHNVKECFENHEEIIPVDHNWQKVMKTFGYIQSLCYKFPRVTILLDETKPAITLKGPRDQSKAAADCFMELVVTAQSEVKEDIFSPGCQFEIFTYPEMCDYINNIIMEISIVWIPNKLTTKIHLFSKKLDKIKGIDKTIKGCVQERAYPLQRDQSVHSPEICNSLETLKKKHTGKIVVNPSARGLLVTTADDIFESVDAAMQEIISKHTGDISDNRQVKNGGTSNTVEVRGFSANINKELLEMYFENSRRSGGGDTEEVQIGDGVAYITFKEAEVAQRVVSRSNHQVDGQPLIVTLLHPSPSKSYYKNRVLIQGLNNAITEEMLTNFLETVTEAKVREFLYGEDEGKVVMMLSDNIDIAQLRKIFRERSIERAFLQVARVDISNCIIVQNLQPSTSHDVVLYYFEDMGRSGGRDVERVEMKAEERYCLVYFEDHSVIDRVLSQSHKVDGADVEVHLHHECLGQRSSRNRFDSYLRISSPGKTDSAVLEEENRDNKANDKTSNSVSSNPEKENDFVEVQEWQENDEEDSHVDIAIVTGIILDQQVQVIVNSTTKNLNLADGNLTSAILAAAGSTIQDECRKVYRGGIKFGEIAVTSAGKLKFHRIFHGALCPLDKSDLHLLSLRTMMKNCLEKAKEERCHSIAFPALGIGRLNYPVDVVAKEMFRAVTTYARRCGIKYVLFVLPEDDAEILSIFKEMGNTMKKSLQDSQDCQPEYEVSLDDCKVKIAITAGNKVTMCDVDVVFGNPSAGTHVETLIFKYSREKITVNRDPKKWSETQYLHSKNMHNLCDGLIPTLIYMKKMKFTSCTLHLSKLDKEDNCKSAITKVIQALDECRSDHGDLERVTILISNYMIQKLRPWFDENVIASSSKKSSKTKFMGFFGSKTKTTWKKLSPANRDARLTYVQITGTDCDVVKRSSDAVQKGFRELTIQKKEESVKNEEMEEVSYRIPEKMDSHGVQPSDRFS